SAACARTEPGLTHRTAAAAEVDPLELACLRRARARHTDGPADQSYGGADVGPPHLPGGIPALSSRRPWWTSAWRTSTCSSRCSSPVPGVPHWRRARADG